MNKLIIATFTKAIIALHMAGAVASASDAPDHIADFIRYEVEVAKMVPDTPVSMEQVIKGEEEFLKLLIESGNEKLQLAYIKKNIVGTLEMVPFDDWNVTLDGFKKEISEFSGNGSKEPDMGDYVRLRAQLAVVYAGVFKKEYGMSFSPKVEGILSRIKSRKD